MTFRNHIEFAQKLDLNDPLKEYRDMFHIPKHKGAAVSYFTGNSLGLQPKTARKYVEQIMKDWEDLAVDGHFYAKEPWWEYHEMLAAPLAKIVGAKLSEVSVMNTLTVNLHFLMVSFYRPTATRYKILCEEKAFPSDQYMFQSQVKFHGLDPTLAIVEIAKRPGEDFWRKEDLLAAIDEHGDSLALVLMGGVNYYNGQVFPMQEITSAAKEKGAYVGWDLAHAAGNVPLDLHNWGVDFASWCSYKYLNSGPGNAAAIYIHEQYLNRTDLPRFEGWWGSDKDLRFKMQTSFVPMSNADAWQVSNAPILAMAPFLASLEIFNKVGMEALWSKQKLLVGFLEHILKEVSQASPFEIRVITPKERGSQLSVYFAKHGRTIFDSLMAEGFVTDWREPNVMRFAPVPLYTTFEDIYRLGLMLERSIKNALNDLNLE
ncbi:MAG: kynureninase [Flavobacteriaceae bacterium]|jgi:kynureninase